MPDQENNRPSSRKTKREPLLPVLVLFVILVLTIAGGAIYFFSDFRNGEPTGSVEEPSASLQQDFQPDGGSGPEVAPPKPDQIPPEPDPASGLEPDLAGDLEISTRADEDPQDKSTITANELQEFFSHIDQQDYLKPFRIQEPAQLYFISLAERLLANPPVVARESDDLYTILRNMAHFFRIIGKDNIILIKTILDRERDKIEDVAFQLYQWIIEDNRQSEQFSFDPAMADVYEYAGFFLNTMGGRSYLFRRDSRSRLLVNYYSILLVEHADELGMNRHGIAVSQVIPQLIEEIRSSNQLIYKENYLDRLYELLEKYP